MTFISTATNLVSGSTSDRNVYAVDLRSSTIVRIPVVVNGTSIVGDARHLSISEDGRYVAFVWDKGLGSTNAYVYDRIANAIDLASPTTNGQDPNLALIS